MSIQTLSIVFFNSLAGTICIKYITDYIFLKMKEKDDQILWLLTKINKLESEIDDIHETLDILEETLQHKNNNSSNELINKLIVSNYDKI